jgi:hypothetical protein
MFLLRSGSSLIKKPIKYRTKKHAIKSKALNINAPAIVS